MGIVIADASGRITQTNEEAFRIWKSIEAQSAEFPGEILGWWDSEGRMALEGT